MLSDQSGSLQPLVIGADRPPAEPTFVPMVGPPSAQSDLQPLPVVRDTRWHRLQDEAEKAAAQTIAHARRKAQQILGAARQQAAELLDGKQRLVQESLDHDARAFREQAARLLLAIGNEKEALLERLEYDVAALAADMAGAIVRRKIDADDAIVLDVVRDALSHVADAAAVTVVVSPSDEPLVRAHLHALTRALQTMGKVTIVSADDIERGGCVVKAEDATVDARVKAQIERTKARLANALETSSPLPQACPEQSRTRDRQGVEHSP